jgi:hypothetical protein
VPPDNGINKIIIQHIHAVEYFRCKSHYKGSDLRHIEFLSDLHGFFKTDLKLMFLTRCVKHAKNACVTTEKLTSNCGAAQRSIV